MCNARCVGCISDQPEDGPPASHERMDDGPSAEEMGGHRRCTTCSTRRAATMVSFGQGCEGEPLTRYKAIAEAIRYMRAQTDRGSHQHQHQRQPHRTGWRRCSTRGWTRCASR